MSNRCPHCGAAGGKSHEPCPYGPGGKFYQGRAKPASQALRRYENDPPVKSPGDYEDGPLKRKSKVAELQVKTESVKTKAARPQSRTGKKAATVWLSPDEMKRLQQASLDHGVPQERIMAEAIAEILAGKYKL